MRGLSNGVPSGNTLQLIFVCNAKTLEAAKVLTDFSVNSTIGNNGFRRFDYSFLFGANQVVRSFSEVNPLDNKLYQPDLHIPLYTKKNYSAQEIWSPLLTIEKLGNKMRFPSVLQELLLGNKWPLTIRFEDSTLSHLDVTFDSPSETERRIVLGRCFGISEQLSAEGDGSMEDPGQASHKEINTSEPTKAAREPPLTDLGPHATRDIEVGRSKSVRFPKRMTQVNEVSTGWRKRIDPLVRRWITYKPQESKDTKKAIFEVGLSESGFIVGVKLEKSSNDERWDKAVERAIWASSSWPTPKTQKLPSALRISFGPE